MTGVEQAEAVLEAWGVTGLRPYVAVLLASSLCVVAATLIDLWSGIDAAKANHERIDSHGLRRTVGKMADYFRVLVFGAMIDGLGLFFTWYPAPVCMVLVTVGVIAIEARSVLENSRKKRGHAAEVADMVQRIIGCATEADARKLIGLIKGKDDKKK